VSQYLIDLEREAFVSLCGERRTQERIAAMLKTASRLETKKHRVENGKGGGLF
jgi:hypothetical protein